MFSFFKRAKQIYHQSKAEKKAFLRESLSAQWFDFTAQERKNISLRAQARLSAYLDEIDAKRVLFYASMEDEPSTDNILNEWLRDPEKTLVLTRVCNRTKQLDPYKVESLEDLEMGRFRIRMPKTSCQQIDLSEIDAVVVPGRAFDQKKNRIGRGFGFYDRFLCVIPKETTLIGLAFNFQVIDAVPVEEHDIPMDVIVTQSQVIK